MGDLTTHLLSHTLDRVRADLALLEAVGCISAEDIRVIQERLPGSVVAAGEEKKEEEKSVSPALRRSPPPPPPDPADLSFKAGDIIEIVEETSEDWWVGRLNGRQGMFPSNRCIKMGDDATYVLSFTLSSS
ncbi:hypothetical protein FRC08_013411 [Ceratobasidium sp. 394]|nr:hypothetical protein FRC08_013411 [Ceratobasidium sp. 394]